MFPHLPVPDATVIKLHFVLPAQDEDEYEEYGDRFEVLVEIYWKVFSQACRTIRDLTLLTNIKRLRICHVNLISYRHQTRIMTLPRFSGQRHGMESRSWDRRRCPGPDR